MPVICDPDSLEGLNLIQSTGKTIRLCPDDNWPTFATMYHYIWVSAFWEMNLGWWYTLKNLPRYIKWRWRFRHVELWEPK